jgi:hypothetical protein
MTPLEWFVTNRIHFVPPRSAIRRMAGSLTQV